MFSHIIVLAATISFFAMISPGPDFLIILKNSLRYSRKVAFMTAIGVTLGITTHMIYCVAGIAIVIKTTPWLYLLLRYAGAAYLIWLGVSGLLSRAAAKQQLDLTQPQQDLPLKQAFLQGYLCNLLNPKATLFFLAVFTQILNVNSSFAQKFGIALIIIGEACLWWPCVIYLFQSSWIRQRFFKIQPLLDKFLAIILILLGLNVAFGWL